MVLLSFKGNTAFNGVVLSISEVPDGKADTIINDIDMQLKKLRKAAEQLGIPNHDKFNWTMIKASSSDSASTQKRLNDLLQQCRNEDEKLFSPADTESFDIIRNFCAMHLGVNLRRAFVNTETANHDNTPIDTFVYEFSKLFGCCGSPEYGVGCVQFKDFLIYCSSTSDCNQVYYQTCLDIKLARQIGSRYFVSSHNAMKVLFLAAAALEFLSFNGKSEGNKLERDVFSKLHDTDLLLCLQADALMFHHVYADLVFLAKSKELNKSAFDMQKHYLELKCFLEEIEQHPEIITKCHHQVFVSETRLYSGEFNHRQHKHKCTPFNCIQESLFYNLTKDRTTLFSKVVAGAISMKEKLCVYAADFLPNGRYWNPDSDIVAVLKDLVMIFVNRC